ncbi:hypothetical protein ACIQJX_07540 [Streptomyces griseoviridis]
MPLPPLATPEDASGYGYALPADTAASLLTRASVRIRRAAGQPITPSTVIVQVDADPAGVELPAPPVIEVQEVAAVSDNGTLTPLTGWWWDGERLRFPSCAARRVQVTYRRGWEPLPEGVVELACQVANRLADTPKGMDVGIRSTTVDDYSVTYAAEQQNVAGDLLPGELAALARDLGHVRTVWTVNLHAR